ncbi:sterol desaturase family protein [Aestuariivivens sediminis]|uniref:sterol desaturase family protein n=1 Tax=Aestuariivivens sediminis TaxID=2913557 RepID=UPI001F585E85|nr:sterol desaturase family protein [Aestuariivivens sediminis]
MENIIKLLNAINENYLIVFLIALFYSLERLLGSPFKFDRRLNHFFNNFLFQITFYFANLAFAIVQVGLISWSSENQIGLFYWIEIPLWLKVIIGVMCLDLSSYWFHRLAHNSPLLWRLHRVHHSDTKMDTSTFFRGHPLEVLVFGTSSVVACIIFGLDLSILGVYFIVLLPFLVAQHANFELPDWTDKFFGKVFITPNIHKVHHEQNQFYTDSNFADIFVFWDKLFKTYKYLPVKDMRYGLKEFDTDKKQTFWFLLISPFIKIDRSSNENP